jgi:hypothetical protein
MEQATLGSSHTNLFVDSLDYTNVELHDFYPEYGSQVRGNTNAAVVVTGGPQASSGNWKGSTTNIFAGETSGNYVNYSVSNGAHFSVRDVWNDACCSQVRAADVTGASTFSYAGSPINLPSGTSVAVSLKNFHGKAALVNLGPTGNIDITGEPSKAQVLGLGLVTRSPNFLNNRSDAAALLLHNQTTANPPPGTGASALAEQECCDTSFLTTTLDQLRTQQPTLLAPLPSGVTDVRFYRVFVGFANTGMHLVRQTRKKGS